MILLALVLALYPNAVRTSADLAKAPLIAVCRVESVAVAGPLTADPIEMRASLRVLRSFQRAPAALLQVGYISLGRRGVSPGPPPAYLQAGDVYVIPLFRRRGAWRLIAERGLDLVIPAIAAAPLGEPADAEDFILREIANALVRGNALERWLTASYCGADYGRMRLWVERFAGADEERWLGVGAALLASLGVSRPKTAEFLDGTAGATARFTLISLALGKVTAARQRLIRALVRQSPAHFWGSSMSLAEFAGDPVLEAELREALRVERTGALQIAMAVARAGVPPEAFTLAFRLLEEPERFEPHEMHPACVLVRDYGDGNQFERFLSIVRAQRDAQRRLRLWSLATGTDSPRELRIAGILIDDSRIAYGDQRFSDLAAFSVQRLGRVKLGIKPAGNTRAERDRAIALAREWLRRRKTLP